MSTATLDRADAEVIQGRTEPRIYTPPLEANLVDGELFAGTCDPECEENDHQDPDCICYQDRTTDGYACIAFAEDILHMPLMPWQKWLLIHALELIDDGFGGKVYRFRIVCVEVGRQNGKTVVASLLALWHLFCLHSETVIGAAQDLPKAEDTWFDCVARAEACEDFEDLFGPEGIYKGHPKCFTLFDGCEYRVAAKGAGDAGRGFSGDLILLDELRTHKDWKTWSAITNTMNARPEAQCWAFSNAGDATSVVLRYQRALAHRDLGWPDGDREFDGVLDTMDAETIAMLEEVGDIKPGWFEWSAPPKAKRGDAVALSYANPSMNHHEITRKCPTTRTLIAACFSSPAYEVETEVMCRWATMGVGGPFPEDSWEQTINGKARPDPKSIRVVCVEVSSKRSQAYVARAVMMPDGRTPLAAIRYDHPGTDWVADALLRDKNKTDAVVIRTDTGGSALKFKEELERKLIGMKILEWKSGDVNVAHQQIFDRLRDRAIQHYPHPGLDIAATTAEALVKPGGGFVVDIKKSPTDVGALYAVIGAVWGLEKLTAEQYNVLDSVAG